MRFCHGDGLYNINIDDEILELQKADGNFESQIITIILIGSKDKVVIIML